MGKEKEKEDKPKSAKDAEKEKKIWTGELEPIWHGDTAEKDRLRWIEQAKYEDPDFPQEAAEARTNALKHLYGIVSNPEKDFHLREVIWGDMEVRMAILSCLEATHDELVRTLAVGCLVKLSLSLTNRRMMLEDEEMVEFLGECVDMDAPDLLRERCYIFIANLLLEMKGSEDTEIAERLIEFLMHGLNTKNRLDIRQRTIGAVWSAVSCEANTKLLWQHEILRNTLMDCLNHEEHHTIRSQVLAVIWAMTACADMREPLWQERKLRNEIVHGLPAKQPTAVRIHALNIIRNFSLLPSLQEPVWNAKHMHEYLIKAVSFGEKPEVRSAALHVLVELGRHYRIGQKMVLSGDSNVFQQAVDDETFSRQDRQAAGHAINRLQGAEEWDCEFLCGPEPDWRLLQKQEEEAAALAEQPEASEGSAVASGAPSRVESKASRIGSKTGVDTSKMGSLQAGVHERAAAGYGAEG